MGDEIAAGLVGAFAALLIPFTAYCRRPRVTLREDTSGVHSRVEGNGNPFIRILVRNSRLRRSAVETTVFVDHYQPRGGEIVTLGCPRLAWTSHFEDVGPTVFAGWERPFDLGQFIQGKSIPLPGFEHDRWYLWLALGTTNAPINLADGRNWVPASPNGVVFRLTVGAADSAGRTYDVDVNWNSEAHSAEEVLASLTMAVR